MVYNSTFQPKLDYGNAINVANTIQMNSSKIKIYSNNDPVMQSESVDGDIRTYSIVGYGSSDYNFIDLGMIYDLYKVVFYFGPGDSFTDGNFQYLATTSGSDAPWNQSTWVWETGVVQAAATYVPTTSGYSWGPVNYIECSGVGSVDKFSARWIKFKANSGSNRIYEIEAVPAMSGALLSGVFFSATSGGDILNHASYEDTFSVTLQNAQQGSAGPTTTLWIVNSGLFGGGAITSGFFSVVNSTSLYDDSGATPGYNGYYAINYSTDGTNWYSPASGILPVGSIPADSSIPIYLRYNPSSSIPLGSILSYIRFTYTV